MNKKVLNTLEYDKIVEQLAKLAGSDGGKKLCRSLTPMTDRDEILEAQCETSDALTHIMTQGPISFQGVTPIKESLKRLELGAPLSMRELLDISSLLACAGQTKHYFRKSLNENEETGDCLNERYQLLEPLAPLMQEIRRCIIAEDEMADDASAGLNQVRRKLKSTGDRIHEQLGVLLNSHRSMLQDAIITMRNGRYCLPVKAEYRSSFHGMLHDQSATGATLFIEPNSVVKLNNEIRELERLEQDEIDKVLADLSNQTAEQSFLVEQDHRILTELDFIFAKAMLAKQMKATKPRFPEERFIEIKQGRHPLIAADKVVPIDVHLGRDFSLLIVTGPNTGGKTVSLKTVGLFCLMGQAGLHIPAFDGSSLRIFHEVYADIGDEQSIEQSLSTFSSHMVNTVSILEQADENSLALFDELGAGTDPTEGAALATAILANLHKRHTLTMATTHYSELKLYALQTPDVENACCEFDVSTLRPTYRLLIGVPGKSNAFAISHKLGLSDDIIEDAKHHVASDATQFEDVLADLEQTRIRLEKELADASESRKEISRLRKELREKNDKIDNSKERILQNANEEAGRILAKAKDYADETIRKYTKWAESDAHIREMEAERTKLREQINSKQSHSLKPAKPKKASGLKAKDLFIGADVRILSLNSAGTVSTLPNDKGDLFVQAGLLRTKVNIRDLELIKQPKPEKNKPKNTGSGRIGMSKAATMHQEVNLIGMTVDQAMPVMEKYLDDAYLAHMTQVTVIHGRGTGALRTAVHNRLKKLKYVKSYRLGEFGEGDMGVTIVTFKS
ncbi:MAG: endonuclease MutS2 [Clostridium sp.]|jgi:DNA mismatch repair protein MutS2|uniref:endonuclease MutS2 n=1 Tax=Clostridium sp. AM49-4BH TaxID=2293035 RepID=UPI000E524ADC|nr:endonuclease MutS2 [Clostridium sp. AM49-4BH]RHQ14292.1 endonuclease MutS2 [Clostridium sp. AM49-4BH]